MATASISSDYHGPVSPGSGLQLHCTRDQQEICKYEQHPKKTLRTATLVVQNPSSRGFMSCARSLIFPDRKLHICAHLGCPSLGMYPSPMCLPNLGCC